MIKIFKGKKGCFKNQQGQLLLEILVVVGITAIIGSIAAQIIYAGMVGNKVSSERNIALGLAEGTFEEVQNVAIEKWQNIYNLNKGSTAYYPQESSGKWIISSGSEQVVVGNITFTRYLYIKNVCRESSGDGRNITGVTDSNGSATTCTTSGGVFDPSTQKIVVTVSWPAAGANPVSMSDFISRWPNKSCNQTSWQTSGSSGAKNCPDTTYDSATDLDVGTELQLSM
jgi:type II secretory pathway pseudopilin PulG